ncbi:MAG: hypothetical protein KAI44_05270, partial [Methylococcales bacterium]|nr:hypothetical protein [Methylococcales bacterium]
YLFVAGQALLTRKSITLSFFRREIKYLSLSKKSILCLIVLSGSTSDRWYRKKIGNLKAGCQP